jgi:hypothetical protein
MRTIIANKTWITLLSLCALVVSTFVTAAPAMSMSHSINDISTPCSMNQSPMNHHDHHSGAVKQGQTNHDQCVDSEQSAHGACCTTLCGTTLGSIWSFTTPGETLSRFSKRSFEHFKRPIERIEHLERPPTA